MGALRPLVRGGLAEWTEAMRPAAEALLPDRCRINAPDVAARNPVTNVMEATPGVLRYDGPSSAQQLNTDRQTFPAMQFVRDGDYRVVIPYIVSETTVQPGDVVRFYESTDTLLLTTELEVLRVLGDSTSWQRDLICLNRQVVGREA